MKKQEGIFEATCDYCKKTYFTNKSVYDRRKHHFCCWECYSMYRGGSILVRCSYCGKEYSEYRSTYKQSNRHFCSRGCYSNFRSELLPHEEQNAFGRGHTTEERDKRKKARIIFNHYLRDKHIEKQPCEICGNPKAEAHHDDYDKPLEIRWLCIKCHRKWHKEINQILKGE